jgi:ABC-type Na+ transport system ATPase subunit NatA
MSDELAIEASGLVKSYRDVRVLSGVDLRVPRGSVFALLGPNGAGKTTIVRILATLTRADAGQARVAGFDVLRDRSAVRRRISLTGQFAALDEAQTGEENLRMMGRLSRLSRTAARRRAAELIEQFELTAAGRRRVGTYSGGMRRRLDLAASLVGRPSVIFLDEPSTGLDLQSRLTMWQVTADLAASGVSAPEAANSAMFFLMFFCYASSAFVPVRTMPWWLRRFARHQPATPVTETIRGLLLGQPGGGVPLGTALAWCGGILVASVALSVWLFRRRTV